MFDPRWCLTRANAEVPHTASLRRLTNATKVTVSVLYWYEELSSPRLATFGMVLRNFFLCVHTFSPLLPFPSFPFHRPRSFTSQPLFHTCLVSCVSLPSWAFSLARRGEKKRWEYDTPGSQVITDLSTNGACGCLTSQIGRDMVFSTKYGRTRWVVLPFRAPNLASARSRTPLLHSR